MTLAEKPPRASRAPEIAFAIVLVVFVVHLVWAGRFPHVDEIAYKAAGREWAMTGRFAAPESWGWIGHDDLWSYYPPLYPFLFGVYARVLGFGWRLCVLFDALIHAALALAAYRLVRQATPTRRATVAILVGLAVLPLGTAGRMDELAMVFGLCAVHGVWREGDWRQLVGSGVLLGLCGGTSTPAAIVYALITTPLLLAREASYGAPSEMLDGRSFTRRARRFFVFQGVAVLVALAIWGPLLLANAEGPRWMLNHSKGLVRHGFREELWSAFRNGTPTMLLIGGGVVIAAWQGVRAVTTRRGSQGNDQVFSATEWVRRWLGVSVAIGFLVAYVPDKYTYFWFVGPWLIAMSGLTIAESWSARRRASAIVALLLLSAGVAYGARQVGTTYLVMRHLPDDQSADVCRQKLRGSIPDGATVLTDQAWWLLADRCHVLDAGFSRADEALLARIDFVVMSGTSSGPEIKPVALPPQYYDYVERHFEIVEDALNREPIEIFGRMARNTMPGFGYALYARKRDGAPSP